MRDKKSIDYSGVGNRNILNLRVFALNAYEVISNPEIPLHE